MLTARECKAETGKLAIASDRLCNSLQHGNYQEWQQINKLHQVPTWLTQGSYRNLTAVLQTFLGQNYLFFQTFQGILFIFMWTKTLQNWHLNAKISYTIYSSIPNTECDSNFWTLSFRCFVSWTTRKLTNASVINSVTDICIFHVNITVFKDFSGLFHTCDHFQDFSRPWKFLH